MNLNGLHPPATEPDSMHEVRKIQRRGQERLIDRRPIAWIGLMRHLAWFADPLATLSRFVDRMAGIGYRRIGIFEPGHPETFEPGFGRPLRQAHANPSRYHAIADVIRAYPKIDFAVQYGFVDESLDLGGLEWRRGIDPFAFDAYLDAVFEEFARWAAIGVRDQFMEGVVTSASRGWMAAGYVIPQRLRPSVSSMRRFWRLGGVFIPHDPHRGGAFSELIDLPLWQVNSWALLERLRARKMTTSDIARSIDAGQEVHVVHDVRGMREIGMPPADLAASKPEPDGMARLRGAIKAGATLSVLDATDEQAAAALALSGRD